MKYTIQTSHKLFSISSKLQLICRKFQKIRFAILANSLYLISLSREMSNETWISIESKKNSIFPIKPAKAQILQIFGEFGSDIDKILLVKPIFCIIFVDGSFFNRNFSLRNINFILPNGSMVPIERELSLKCKNFVLFHFIISIDGSLVLNLSFLFNTLAVFIIQKYFMTKNLNFCKNVYVLENVILL